MGDFACLAVDEDRDTPDRVQIVGASVFKDFSGTRIYYHVRAHSGYKSDLLQFAEEELLAYPTEQALAARAAGRDAVRAEARAARDRHLAGKQAA